MQRWRALVIATCMTRRSASYALAEAMGQQALVGTVDGDAIPLPALDAVDRRQADAVAAARTPRARPAARARSRPGRHGGRRPGSAPRGRRDGSPSPRSPSSRRASPSPRRGRSGRAPTRAARGCRRPMPRPRRACRCRRPSRRSCRRPRSSSIRRPTIRRSSSERQLANHLLIQRGKPRLGRRRIDSRSSGIRFSGSTATRSQARAAAIPVRSSTSPRTAEATGTPAVNRAT